MSEAVCDGRGSRRVALVSARAARERDEDMAPLVAALEACAVVPEVLDWDDPHARWAEYDLTVLRSTWDYPERIVPFRAWLKRVSAQTRLENPAPLVAWNTDKHYLRDLAAMGLPTVPSAFIEPGEPVRPAIQRFLAAQPCTQFVVKPAVGAGSRGARRLDRDRVDEACAHATGLLNAMRSVVLQPYLDSVDRLGETALLFFAGTFSHAIRKGPLLQPNAQCTAELFAPEQISACTPRATERAVGERVLAALTASGRAVRPALYARVDLICDPAGMPCVLELELAEPSLFLRFADGASARFAERIAEVLCRGT